MEGFLVRIKRKMSFTGYVMWMMDTRWTIHITERLPRNVQGNRGRSRILWRDELRKFRAENGPDKLTIEAAGDNLKKPLSCSECR